jgi:hypothetical protein
VTASVAATRAISSLPYGVAVGRGDLGTLPYRYAPSSGAAAGVLRAGPMA